MTLKSVPDEPSLSATDRSAYAEIGAICLRGVFTEWVETLRAGVERNMHDSGPHAAENLKPGEAGRFFNDYCNCERIPEFREFVLKSPAARLAAEVPGSRTAQFFHEHLLVKEPGTFKATPWHQVLPYYFLHKVPVSRPASMIGVTSCRHVDFLTANSIDISKEIESL